MMSEVKRTMANDWDAPGILSIVAQGSVFKGNLVETANACRHWRMLFPQAEIVLSIPSSDIIIPTLEGSRMISADLALVHAADGVLRAAIADMQETCDVIVWAQPRLPLPPIKSDAPKANNMNFQIAGARAGLAAATGRHVLRIRTDAFFASREFLTQWEEGCQFPRGSAAVFKERVLISWLFTLNPYTIERLPLHFSDWFHFGLTDDVRRVWDIPDVTLADSIFYLSHPHLLGSTAGERLFNTRIAVEQHVAYHCFKPHFPELMLERHNDLRSADLSVDILRDNFVLSDLVAAHYVFPKYGGELDDPTKSVHCLTPEDWRSLVTQRDRSARGALAAKILSVTDPRAYQRSQPFPRVYRGRDLMTKCGVHINGAIVGTGKAGTLVFGPLVEFPGGRYVALIELATLRGPGELSIEAKIEQQHAIAKMTVSADETTASLQVALRFDVDQPAVRNFEIVIDISGLNEVAVGAIAIHERSPSQDAGDRQYGAALLTAHESDHRAGAVVSRKPSSAFTSTTKSSSGFGRLFTGPRDLIPPGTYVARLLISQLSGQGTVQLRVFIAKPQAFAGATLVAAQRFPIVSNQERRHIDIGFTVPAASIRDGGERIFELDCTYEGLESFAVSGVELTHADPAGSTPIEIAVTLDNLWLGEAARIPAGISAASEQGVVFYGPYARIEPGRYRATILLMGGESAASVQIKATCDAGRKTLAARRAAITGAAPSSLAVDFVVPETKADFELVLRQKRGRGLKVTSVAVERLA